MHNIYILYVQYASSTYTNAKKILINIINTAVQWLVKIVYRIHKAWISAKYRPVKDNY